MIVAFQGEHGAYSEAAVFNYFPVRPVTLPCESFDVVFQAVQAGDCDCGMIPIENSLAGSIHCNYDLLVQNELSIIGEYSLRVSHCLIAHPGVQLKEIKKVISHPQALAQCEKTLRRLDLHTSPVYDTAGSVKIVKEQGERTQAAIASRLAGELYEMAIVMENVEDDPANFTRFLVISTQPATPGQGAKTSIVFAMQNIPGALFRALSVFALRDIDLTKIESRPLVGKPWQYLFYIDFVGSLVEEKVNNALNNLNEYAYFVRILGSYPRNQMITQVQ